MIKRYKNFGIFKAKQSDNDKLPTHAISMKIGEEFINIGGAWTKDGVNGKYLSSKLADTWVNTQDNKKSRKGYCIVCEEDLNELEKIAYKGETVIDPVNGRELSLDDMPF